MGKPDQGSAEAEGAPEGDRSGRRARPVGGRFSARRKRETVLRPAAWRGSRVRVAGAGDHGGAGVAVA